jgi:cell division septal protein FtsQ
MFKKRTTKVRHSRQLLQLQASVVSPRILWFGFLKACRRCARLALLAAFGVVAVWGIRRGIQHGLVENEEFRLQSIEMTPNPAIDERRLVEIAGIDLKGSLFDCDAGEIESKLRALPEIATANVRREFPGTLVVQVAAREPYAWVASPGQGIEAHDDKKGLLVDRSGVAFPCLPPLLDAANRLPVFYLGEGGEPLAAGQPVKHPEFDRLVRLYKVACEEIPGAADWIYSLRQDKAWSLELVTREGTSAYFGLGDHKRQMGDFEAILKHARENSQQIASIELIPERNIPVILRGSTVPRAILIEEPHTPSVDRRSRDVRDLLNR